jgi:hypothetical protein
MTSTEITTKQIEDLRTAAAQHGDDDLYGLCCIALDDLDNGGRECVEDKYRGWTRDQARAKCAKAIAAGQG